MSAPTTAAPSRSVVDRLSGVLARRTSRRGFLARAALVGTAVAAAPGAYLLRQNDAYAAVCGPGAACGSGWTVFCCSVNRGMNKCPPGTFVAGWWKADNSSYCCDSSGNRRARYIIDCNARCDECTSGCANGFCNPSCYGCSCTSCHNDPNGCDNRRHCCNNFRYGQCHQEIGCSGPVACRVVTCSPPWQVYSACSSRTLTDNRTSNHNAPCLGGTCT